MVSFPKVSQSVSGGYYMQNLVSIAEFLMDNGYSRAAAAGVAGTIAGESSGSPEAVGSGGAGLIGWTPPSSASPIGNIVSNNWQQDFDNQLVDLLNYANSNSSEAVARGGVDLQTLKNATSPTQAAAWWSAFEGPLVPGSDVRDGVANSVYSALSGYKAGSKYTDQNVTSNQSGGGNQAQQTATLTSDPILPPLIAPWLNLFNVSTGVSGFTGTITDIAVGISGIVHDMGVAIQMFAWLFNPQNWLRIGAFIFGLFALAAGAYFLKEAL